MTIQILEEYLTHGREIEFSLNNHMYFMSSSLDGQNNHFYIWDSKSETDIISGTINDILSFEFENGISLKNNIECFRFDYIF